MPKPNQVYLLPKQTAIQQHKPEKKKMFESSRETRQNSVSHNSWPQMQIFSLCGELKLCSRNNINAASNRQLFTSHFCVFLLLYESWNTQDDQWVYWNMELIFLLIPRSIQCIPCNFIMFRESKPLKQHVDFDMLLKLSAKLR